MNNLLKNGDLTPMVPPLLQWYRAAARRLPWRENTDPYRVWVSEIMLQQTRVDAVIPYYERFLAALPTIEALAQAPEEQLLKLWEGLGYYNRVRNMQKAARVLAEQYGGVFPKDEGALRALPGIGEYTAGAVGSIALNLPLPAVDGNVLRVISRLTCNMQDVSKAAVKREITGQVRRAMPPDATGDFTQALMELGALVCLPNGAPQCGKCPVAALCLARQAGKQEELPVLPEKKARRKEKLTVFLLLEEGKIALQKRPMEGLLAGLWEFPHTPGSLTQKQAADWMEEAGVTVESMEKLPKSKHIFSHVEWQMTGYLVRTAHSAGDWVWADLQELRQTYSLPSAWKAYQNIAEGRLEKAQ